MIEKTLADHSFSLSHTLFWISIHPEFTGSPQVTLSPMVGATKRKVSGSLGKPSYLLPVTNKDKKKITGRMDFGGLAK